MRMIKTPNQRLRKGPQTRTRTSRKMQVIAKMILWERKRGTGRTITKKEVALSMMENIVGMMMMIMTAMDMTIMMSIAAIMTKIMVLMIIK